MKQKYIDFLNENEKYFDNLKSGLSNLENYANTLRTNYAIDISEKPWYINIISIYVPQAKDYYENCKKSNFEVEKNNSIWIRSTFKSYLSEIEKFIKFFTKVALNVEPRSFYDSIENLKKIAKNFDKHSVKDSSNMKSCVNEIINVLHDWRQLYNENKHNFEKLDACWFIDEEAEKLYIYGADILEYVSDTVFHIVNPLLFFLIDILKQNKLNRNVS